MLSRILIENYSSFIKKPSDKNKTEENCHELTASRQIKDVPRGVLSNHQIMVYS